MILGLAQCRGTGVGKAIWSLFRRPTIVVLTASGQAALGDTVPGADLECISLSSLAISPVGLPGKRTVPHPLLGPRPHSSLLPSLEQSIFSLGRIRLLSCFFDCDNSQEFTSKCKANTSRIFRVGLFSDLPHATPEAMHTKLT